MAGPSFNKSEEDCEDTFSFPRLVDQGKDGKSDSPARLLPADPDFEFDRAAHPFSSSSAAILSSNGQLPPQPLPTPGSVFPPGGSSRSSSRGSSGSRSGRGSRRRDSGRLLDHSGAASAQHSPADQGWRFFGTWPTSATLPPSSSKRGSSRRKIGAVAVPPEVKPPRGGTGKLRHWLLGSVMSGCKVCHAVEPSKPVKNSFYVA